MTAQAGKGDGKRVPEGGVATRGLPQEKDMKTGVPDGDVEFRKSSDGKPKTAAEEKAAKQERQDRFRRRCSTDGCDTCVEWDHMLSIKIYSSDDEDASFQRWYECAVCLALCELRTCEISNRRAHAHSVAACTKAMLQYCMRSTRGVHSTQEQKSR